MDGWVPVAAAVAALPNAPGPDPRCVQAHHRQTRLLPGGEPPGKLLDEGAIAGGVECIRHLGGLPVAGIHQHQIPRGPLTTEQQAGRDPVAAAQVPPGELTTGTQIDDQQDRRSLGLTGIGGRAGAPG